MKDRRMSMSAEELSAANSAVFERAAQLLREYEPKRLFSYVSVPPLEVDTRGLLTLALDNGIAAAVPKCTDRRGEMVFYNIGSLSELSPGACGIDEPDPGKCSAADLSEGGLCIVPGLAFDRRGCRLGFGGGYYDRFLADFGGMKVGLCFECCLEDALPAENFDIRVDAVITEADIYRF